MLLSVGLAVFCLGSVLGSHFRGGTVSWQVTNVQDGVYRLRFPFRMAWRRDSLDFYCDAAAVASGQIMGDTQGNLMCSTGGCAGQVIGNLGFHCTDFSIQEDWSTGTNVLEYDYDINRYESTDFEIGYGGCCWIGGMNAGGGSWAWRSRINLAPRNDNGVINTSPVTAMAPIVRLQLGCCHTISVPAADHDGDNVRCRWASGQECGGVCNSFSGSTLDQESCQISYCANTMGWFPVALQLEDFYTTDAEHANPISSIPLQFLVYVYQASEDCDATTGPAFIDPTPVDGSRYTVLAGNTIQFDLTANASGSAVIQSIDTVSPSGMVKGSLTHESDHVWSVHVSWTPTAEAAGENILCFDAVDSKTQRTPEECITIAVETETTEAPTTPTTAPPCFADIVFVVDTSDSICETVTIGKDCVYWDSMKQFLNNFTDSFIVGSDQTRMSLVHFSSVDNTALSFDLAAYTTNQDVVTYINGMDYWKLGGDTDTGKGLTIVRDNVLTTAGGDRKAAPNVVILFTDGNWDVGPSPVTIANQLWTRGDTYIFAVGIGSQVDPANLLQLVHQQSNVYTVDSYLELGSDLKEKLLTATGCHDASDHCEPDPCLNGATCVSNDASFVCQCADGYMGYDCSEVVPCQTNPCINGGTCIPHGATFVCACIADWIGQYCEYPNPCQDGGCTDPTNPGGATTVPVVIGHCVEAGADFDCKTVADGNYNDPGAACSSHYFTCVGGAQYTMPCAAETYFDCVSDACNIKQLVPACN